MRGSHTVRLGGKMRTLDMLVIAAYGAGVLAVGRYYARRTETADDYLLGGRRMNPLLIGLSLFATITSTLSYLAYPGEMVKYGPMIFAGLAAFPLVLIIVGWWLIPAIMRERSVTSGYELLEARLGLSGRLLGAGMFVALRTVWMASILYATSEKVIVPMFQLNRAWAPWVGTALGLVTMIYTMQGGLRAVVLTDVLQALIMFGGAVATILVVTVYLGGVDRWWPRHWQAHWQEPVFWFRSSTRVTFMGAFLNSLVWTTCTAGSDQMAIQRYLSTRDARAARRSLAIHMLTEILMSLLLAVVGLAVLGYFTAHPELSGRGDQPLQFADELLPRFVMVGMPAGASGLVIAAILSAAMSSLSSGMNSSSAVISADWINRFWNAPSGQADQVRQVRVICIIVGGAAIALSTVVGELAENLLELCVKVVNLLTAPIFVLFFLALFVPWATPLGGMAATVASVSVAAGIAFYHWFDLEFLWSSPCSLLAGVTVGMLVSLLPIGKRHSA